MSETNEPASANTASHTLALLRRLEQKQAQLTDLLIRQQDLIGRLDRDMRESFSTVARDVRELRSDIVLMENRVLTAVTSNLDLTSRLDEHDAQIGSLEARSTVQS